MKRINEKREFVIQIKDLSSSLRDFAKAYKKLEKGEKIKPIEKLTFVDIGVFRKFATLKRIELLRIIKEKKPRSLKELERLSKRDYKSINTDLKVLKKLNLVDIKKEDNKSVPKINYDEISIKIPISA